MNRLHFTPRFWLFLFTLIVGQVVAFGQYYPPAVSVSGLDSYPVTLNGGGGSYWGGYYYNYTYEYTEVDGYWDYTAYGHYENQEDGGYWDTTPGHYEDQGTYDYTQGSYDAEGNLVYVPVWVPNFVWVSDPEVWTPYLVQVWVNDPTWVDTSTTSTQTATTYVSVSLAIDSSGVVSISSNDSSSGYTYYWTGNYDFSTGELSGGIPTTYAIETDGTTWVPPAATLPEYPSFGPPSIWVEGAIYSWSYTEFTDSSYTNGTDYYVDGSGHSAWFQSAQNGPNNIGGMTPESVAWTGTASSGIFENTGTFDVRAADISGNFLRSTAPEGLPPAISVDGGASLWNYIGQGSSVHHYAGDQSHQRLTINTSTGAVSIQDDNTGSIYNHKVIWPAAGGHDVRAVSLDGSLYQTDLSPSWGPPDAYVSQTLWRYIGTWDGSITISGWPGPQTGDHYLGPNNGQRLVVDGSGNVTVFGMGSPLSGTYAPLAQQEGAPRVFTVNGCDIYPGDENGGYHNTQPAIGPPAIWVNGVNYSFSSSNEDSSQVGTWVDSYMNGSDNIVLLSASEVRSFHRQGTGFTSDWAGYYVPADSNLGDGGIFVVVAGSPRFDVRASNGGTLLPPQGSPLNSHPNVVKVDGVAWEFGGSTSDTDYYFGANPGERLWIDSDNVVKFTNTLNSPNLAGSGHFSGSVFLMDGHDLRAHTSDPVPVDPVGTPQWGPAALWVEGTIWNFIGAVSDDTLQVHADFYGGMNAGQVVKVDSSMQVTGAYSGVFADGVFVVGGLADLRALDATGAQLPPVGAPANGSPTSLRIGGLHWSFIGTHDGIDYYVSALGGQRLSVDADGAVTYSDRPHHVNGATGSYAGGIFTSISGGMTFNAGTIGSDLDILGNIVSFGSLQGSQQTAGVTLQFVDDGTIATLHNSLGRSQTRWGWNRATSDGSLTSLPVMQLDTQGRLNIFDPATATDSQVQPTISLAPGINAGVQVSKLPRLELSQQTLESDDSVLTKALADLRYLQSAGDGQNLSSLTVTGTAIVNGSMSVAGSPVLTQAGADAIYVRSDQIGGASNTILTQTAADLRYLKLDEPTINNSPVLTQDSADTRYIQSNLISGGSNGILTQSAADDLYLPKTQPMIDGSPVLTQSAANAIYFRSDQPVRVQPAGDISMGEFNHVPEPDPVEE